jgi:hypothetical protein
LQSGLWWIYRRRYRVVGTIARCFWRGTLMKFAEVQNVDWIFAEYWI